MSQDNQNIYRNARNAAGLTQEAAAERLGISVESVRAYETNGRIPPDKTVESMVVCYNAQHLAYQHLQESNTLLSRVVPVLSERDVLKICIRVYNRMRQLSANGELDRLLCIAEDGLISPKERPEFDHILGELREIIRGGLELSVFCGGLLGDE